MASAAVEINVKEVVSLASKLSGLALKPSEREKLLTSLGVELEAQTQERFDTKVDPEGNEWEELSEKYRAYLSKRFPGAEPQLVVSGDLRDTIESQVESWKVTVGATKEYAAVHNFGFEKKKIPKRQYLGIGLEDERELEAIVDAFIEERLSA